MKWFINTNPGRTVAAVCMTLVAGTVLGEIRMIALSVELERQKQVLEKIEHNQVEINNVKHEQAVIKESIGLPPEPIATRPSTERTK